VPGLGKSPEAIAVCNEIGAKRVLVLCPANIRLQWVKVIRRWTTMKYPYTVYPVLHGRHGVNPNANWIVVSYDLASTAAIWKALAKLHYDAIIIDEAHYCKTIDARRTRTVFGGGMNPAAEAPGQPGGGDPRPDRDAPAEPPTRSLHVVERALLRRHRLDVGGQLPRPLQPLPPRRER
jgi:hypothetical protein